MEVFAKDQCDEGEKGAERGTKGVRSHGISLCHVQNNPHGHFLSAILIRVLLEYHFDSSNTWIGKHTS